MSRFRAYIAPLTEDGNSHEDFIEVTDDVDFDSLGNIEQKLDNSDYDVGLASFSNFNFQIRNEHGLYSVNEVDESIFPGRRTGSLFRLTWQKQDFPSKAGMVRCGRFIAANTEITVFEGIINDNAAQMDIGEQKINFTILGKESILSNELVPFSSVSNGMTFKNFLLACLNQASITKYFSVDGANINPAVNLAIDTVANFENKTVSEAVNSVLAAANSIIYVYENVIYIKPRTPSVDVRHSFYGQGSNIGIENIVSITNIMRGINRTFNFWTWQDTTLLAQDATSLSDNGVLKREISFDFITDNTKRGTILTALKEEFKLPKQELVLTTPIRKETLALLFLDRIDIDYPNVYYTDEGQNVPIYDIAVYDDDRYPFGEFSLSISTSDNYKIIGRSISPKDQLVSFKMRKI